MAKPKRLDLECYRGQTWKKKLYYKKDGAAIDLTGLTFKAEVRPQENSPYLTASMVIDVDAAAGEVTFTLPASVTAGIPQNVYAYDIKATDGNDEVAYHIYGKLYMKGRVTE